jgi:Nucleoside 2-deoxyribosyltransferase like
MFPVGSWAEQAVKVSSMARVLKPPAPLELHGDERSLFLAGSIEMGQAELWQTEVERALVDEDVVILNPRRDQWDASWEQSIHDPLFRDQVEWELSAQESATIIAMFFAPATKAPITLLELGLFARSGKLIVCCPDGFWRRGNVEVVCARYGIPLVDRLTALIDLARLRLKG